MRETSELYKRLLADPAHVKESRLTIGGEIYDESKIEMSSFSATEALLIAMSLPIAPMAIPRSPAARAGASLTPSPTTATR